MENGILPSVIFHYFWRCFPVPLFGKSGRSKVIRSQSRVGRSRIRNENPLHCCILHRPRPNSLKALLLECNLSTTYQVCSHLGPSFLDENLLYVCQFPGLIYWGPKECKWEMSAKLLSMYADRLNLAKCGRNSIQFTKVSTTPLPTSYPDGLTIRSHLPARRNLHSFSKPHQFKSVSSVNNFINMLCICICILNILYHSMTIRRKDYIALMFHPGSIFDAIPSHEKSGVITMLYEDPSPGYCSF